jgi:hypothetical protein
MNSKLAVAVILFLVSGSLWSCSPKNISTKYYYENEKTLASIKDNYTELSAKHPFSVGFTDKSYKIIAMEIATDTLTYIYEFKVNEARLADTLTAYHLNAPKVIHLIQQMQSIRCTWIRNYDYYLDGKKNLLVFMSIRPVALKSPFLYKTYYVLTYFNQPQYFDSEGRLLDKRKQRRLRKINGEVFKRINDKVCYTVSGQFR